MLKKQFITILVGLSFLAPTAASALEMPTSGNDLANTMSINAQAYIVVNPQTGQVLMDKNSNTPWVPASLTKLVTALVVLDTKPKLAKIVTMTDQDQVVGWCKSGGACIKSVPGVKFTVDGLFHAALIPSANNAASALARSTGLSTAEFVNRMNKKVTSLGATQTHFNEPTGMDPSNTITAADYVHVVQAAFTNSYLRTVAGMSTYSLKSTNNSKYNQTIKNTDKLLTDGDVQVLGAKTGYLDESLYNFATLLKYQGGKEMVVVVLGERHLYSAFAETKVLASLARDAEALAILNLQNPSSWGVLGTSTVLSIN
jgi:D-alanyl-D-alanine carboxypeptidase (penicillin-binding protein 5/6)